MTPSDEIGCKRIMLTDEWYPTLTRPNVELVADRIATVTASGIRTEDGRERPADVLVLATGFKTHEFVAPMEIAGAGGRTLAQEWAGVARAYLGLTVPGFPNMFVLYGPNTNGGTGSVIYTIEAGMGHVLAALEALDRADARRIEIRRETADEFDRALRAALARDRLAHAAARTGTSTRTATTRASGRGCGTRTAAGPRGSPRGPTRSNNLAGMTYVSQEARQQLLDTVAEATDEIGIALAALGEAYEQLDDDTADTLEEQLFRPVQTAYGRARRTHSGFAERHGLPTRTFEPASPDSRRRACAASSTARWRRSPTPTTSWPTCRTR